MAVLIYFRKAQEDHATVEYTFGYPDMNRRLLIEKETQEARPADGNADHSFAAVAFKILTVRRNDQDWPEAGSYAA